MLHSIDEESVERVERTLDWVGTVKVDVKMVVVGLDVVVDVKRVVDDEEQLDGLEMTCWHKMKLKMTFSE